MDVQGVQIPDSFFTFLIELLKATGSDKFLLAVAITGLVVIGFRIFLFFMKRKEDSLGRTSIEELASNQITITKTLKNLASVIAFINLKIKNIMSVEDCKKCLETATMSKLFCTTLEKATPIKMRIRKNPEISEDIKKEFHISMKNVWGDYIKHLNSFHAPIKLGDEVECNFYEEFCIGKEGSILRQIAIEVFEKDSEPIVFHDRLRELFLNFYLKVDQKISEELKKVKDLLEIREE